MSTLVRQHFTAEIVKSSIDEDKHQVTAMVSTDHPGASREIASPRGWMLDRFRENPVFFYNHATHTDDPENLIGSIVSIERTESGLRARVQYDVGIGNKKADLVWKQVLRGTLKGFSVGFLPHDWVSEWSATDEELESLAPGERAALESGAAFLVFTRQELFEVSQVGVPDKPDTLVRNYVEDRKNQLEEIRKAMHGDIKKPEEEAAPVESSSAGEAIPEVPEALRSWMSSLDGATNALNSVAEKLATVVDKISGLAEDSVEAELLAEAVPEASVEHMTEDELREYIAGLPEAEFQAAMGRLID